jgi:hypothetical protein
VKNAMRMGRQKTIRNSWKNKKLYKKCNKPEIRKKKGGDWWRNPPLSTTGVFLALSVSLPNIEELNSSLSSSL